MNNTVVLRENIEAEVAANTNTATLFRENTFVTRSMVAVVKLVGPTLSHFETDIRVKGKGKDEGKAQGTGKGKGKVG